MQVGFLRNPTWLLFVAPSWPLPLFSYCFCLLCENGICDARRESGAPSLVFRYVRISSSLTLSSFLCTVWRATSALMAGVGHVLGEEEVPRCTLPLFTPRFETEFRVLPPVPSCEKEQMTFPSPALFSPSISAGSGGGPGLPSPLLRFFPFPDKENWSPPFPFFPRLP